ncbi:acyl carrier protein [Acaryochloris marina]|uniref:acyl carrier protein n=1 Tax=Acaryochloris marina TaxID=155978 RepID=UPI001BAFE331|nr:acyl carrier protein [Acaryochloris marina]QUY43026.1 acyl carrier protein [Acaryochloris marina S15]
MPGTTTQVRVIQVISTILNVPTDKLNIDSSPESVEQWESMKHINLVLAIEEEFDVQFDDEQIAELQSVKSIIEAVENTDA